ncbi:unnamed protein product [Pelagomonas calceolata]|uniref:Uncharacterized protein n=1 Tax=Pelagomonas calceolata TaxID=35677 RepID=A0A8J2SID0_9STRA|nr:unnamed protein product [Pelagomonas calceolata]
MPRVWKPAADDQHIFDALPMPEGDVFLSDDELLMEMDGVATRAALNAALGPTARTRVTFDAEGRYWRKSYEIDKEPRCIYFLPAVQNRARALEEYPDGVEPPFPRPEEKFQCKRKQPPRAPRKPSKTTARSGEKRPTSARPRMYTTPGEKVTRVDPVDDAELLVPDEDVVDLDEVAPLNLELYGLRRLRGAWLGSRVAYLPEEPPPDSDFEGESLWPVVHAVGDFLSRICGGTLKRKQQKCLRLLADYAWCQHSRGRGEIGLVRAHFACAEYRRLQEIFSPAELLKTMDVEMTGNYAASEAMRARERAALVALGETLGKHVMLLFPTKFALQETAKLVERVADGHKVSVTETSAGDGTYEAVGIATGAVLDVIGKQYGLLETGRSPADPRRIRGTQDGSNITKSDDFTMQGIHVNDSRAVDPITGKPITDFQSPDRVHITTLAVGHESHALYEALDDVTDHFSTAATAQTDGVYQSEAEGRAVHVDYVCSGDMANLQTVSKKGFATGTSENARPCYCCAQTNRQMTTPKVVDDLCDVCRAAGRLVCYHAEMSTPAAVDEWRATAAAALTELRGELPPAYRYMREAKTLSAAQLRELAAEAGLDAGGTSAHLHARFAAYCGQHCLELENPNQNGFYAKFDCRTATPAQKTQFSLVVNDCLVDFGLAVTGNLGSRVEKLTRA